jgi:nicotinamide-nucleotide amidase
VQPSPSAEVHDRLAARVAELALASGRSVAVAESLTGGMVAQALATAPRASTWFRGSLVAYSSEVKHDVLDVPDGPVVSAAAASAMAREVRRLLRADLALSLTGAAGPEGQDGREPGTVFLAVDGGGNHQVQRVRLPDRKDPAAVCADATAAALELLAAALARR